MRNPTQSLCLLFAFLLIATAAKAQTATATLRGTVEDNSGRTLPGAIATLTNAASGLKRVFTIGDDGQYTFTFLEPGRYTLEIQAQGFKLLRQEGVELAVAQNAELNLRLEPGNITDTVTVSANETALQLDTATGALGGVVQRTQIDDLPLNGRNVFQLAQLEVGVSSSPGSRSAVPSLGAGGVGELSINGGRTLTNEIVVDGVPITNKADNLPSLRPSPDSTTARRPASPSPNG